MTIVTIKTSDIKPYLNNAKKHDPKQIDLVAKSIKKFGFVQPLVVDSDNVLIIGHCRLASALKLGITEVPAIRMENLTPEEVKTLRIADNKLNESPWDMQLVIEDLKLTSNELFELSGFDKDILLTDENFGTDFSLNSDDKGNLEQMTFTLAKEQAEILRQALEEMQDNDEYKYIETFGNENKNGNLIYCLAQHFLNNKGVE